MNEKKMDASEYIGKKFGHLTVLAEVGKDEHNCKLVYCECDCDRHGNKVTRLSRLLDGSVKYCGKDCTKKVVQHIKKKSDADYVGKRFGRLTATGIAYRKNGQIYLNCVCDCGNQTVCLLSNLSKGHTRSCGCIHKEVMQKHGLCGSRIQSIWSGMKDRCSNPNCKEYNNYGGRGITICDEWKNNLLAFYEWALSCGYCDKNGNIDPLLSLDRIDVNGNYEPSNCRFTDVKTQSRNRQNNIYIDINGKRKVLFDWCVKYNLSWSTVYKRYKKGDMGEYLFRKPNEKYSRKKEEQKNDY